MKTLEIDFPSRVTIAMTIDQGDALQGGSGRPVHFDFIWGIGLNGLTDFELALSRKAAGDSLTLAVRPETVHGVFEHLASHVASLCRPDQDVRLTAWIEKIEPVGNRDVVRAIAGLKEGSCGCGGDGGCGCH
ncbi:MAG: hypothetical protein C4522_06215 [Desulfobacteraceae bacterium]|nr:MAG: hypothetical protein C4522_06215 [Desulfobacteraceae bacterium]